MATATILVRPTGDVAGAIDLAVTPAGSAHYVCVDEVTADDADYVSSASVRRDLYTYPSITAHEGSIVSVALHCRVKVGTANGSGYIGVALKIGSTEYTVNGNPYLNQFANTVFPDDTIAMTTNPATGLAWAWDEVLTLLATGIGPNFYQNSGVWYSITQVWVVITYNIATQATLSDVSFRAIGDRLHAIGQGVVAGWHLLSAQVQVASDSAFGSILADSGSLTDTTPVGGICGVIVAWQPTTAGTYYARIGITSPDWTVTWYPTTVVIQLPTMDEPVLTQTQERLKISVVGHEPYAISPSLGIIVDGNALNAAWVSHAGNDFTGEASCDVEVGNHTIIIVVGNSWNAVVRTIVYYSQYVTTETGWRLTMSGRVLSCRDVQVTERPLPDVAEMSCVIQEDVPVGSVIEVRHYAGTMFRWSMAVVSSDLQAGISTIRATSAFRDVVRRKLSAPVACTTGQQLLAYWGVQIVPGDIALQQPVNDRVWGIDIDLGTAIQAIMILEQATAYERDGRIHFLPLSLTPHRALASGLDVARDGPTYNHVLVPYTIIQWPVQPLSWTQLAAALWTGTVVDVAATNNHVAPVSGAVSMLKISTTGTLTLAAPVTASSFSRIHLRWMPGVITNSVTVRLQKDASNYRTYTFSYGGSKTFGFVLSAGSASSIVSQVIPLATSYLGLYTAHITMAKDCSLRITVTKAGATVYQSAWTDTANGRADIGLGFSAGDSLTVEVTNLTLGTSTYQATCTSITVDTLMDSYQPYAGSGIVQTITWGSSSLLELQALAASGQLNAQMPPLTAGQTGSWTFGTMPDGSSVATWVVTAPMTTYTHVQCVGTVSLTASYPSGQEVNMAIVNMTQVGTLDTINSIIISGTGDHYIDELYVAQDNVVEGQVAEAKSGGWTQMNDVPYTDEKQPWNSREAAQLYANRLLTLKSKPQVTYQLVLPLSDPIDLGETVTTEYGDQMVTGIQRDTQKTVLIGSLPRDVRAWVLNR